MRRYGKKRKHGDGLRPKCPLDNSYVALLYTLFFYNCALGIGVRTAILGSGRVCTGRTSPSVQALIPRNCPGSKDR